MKYLLTLLLFICISANASSSNYMWEAGRIDYSKDLSEVAAYVNGKHKTQLQVVLCSQGDLQNYRLSLLLPNTYDLNTILQVQLSYDGNNSTYYAEVNGNIIDFQVDNSTFLALCSSPNLDIIFKEDDAKALDLPKVLSISMLGADYMIKKVAAECVILCVDNKFSCQAPLVSSILWPLTSFNKDSYDLDDICTKPFKSSYIFNPSDKCKAKLDEFYNKEGKGPLSFLYKLFHEQGSSYIKFKEQWNDLVNTIAQEHDNKNDLLISDEDWYILLYSFVGNRNLINYPKSYHEIINYRSDPTTLLYNIDSRYEMEALKYTSVLNKRLKGSLNNIKQLEQVLSFHQDFYRDFINLLPQIPQAQALRPLVYRQMLLRLWLLSGSPDVLDVSSMDTVIQGTNNQTLTNQSIEKKCAGFEGIRGDEYFQDSNQCSQAIHSALRDGGFINGLYANVQDAWALYKSEFEKSVFYTKVDDLSFKQSVFGVNSLNMISILKVYGFGDYFLLRGCIITKDDDICSFEKHKAYESYTNEFRNKFSAIASISIEDANSLKYISKLYDDYVEKLNVYIKYLLSANKISYWQAQFVLACAATAQTDILLNIPYYQDQDNIVDTISPEDLKLEEGF